MTEPFSNSMPKTALITGAAHRIGRAVALDLAAGGWAIAAHYYGSREAAHELVDIIRAGGGRAAALPANLIIDSEVAGLIEAASVSVGPLGCLINNASVFERDGVFDTTRKSWDAHMETNLRAPFALSQAFAAQVVGSGAIINLIDQRVWNLTPHFTSYTVSKAGLWTLTRTLALALAPAVRVNGIGPGPTLPSKRQTDRQFADQIARLPLRRGPSLEEICAAVRFLLGAPSVTGQMIALDGGQHLGWAQPTDGSADPGEPFE